MTRKGRISALGPQIEPLFTRVQSSRPIARKTSQSPPCTRPSQTITSNSATACIGASRSRAWLVDKGKPTRDREN